MRWIIQTILITCLTIDVLVSTPISPASRSLRIVGGNQTSIENYPYQLSMQYQGRHICGAAILSIKFVVTAAHCTHQMSVSSITFRAGSTDRTQGGQIVKAKSIQEHPTFNFDTVDYDVAVVEVNPKLVFKDKIKNIALAIREPPEGAKVKASGWGTQRETSNRIPTDLRAVELPIVSRSNCKKAYRRRAEITERMICAGVLHRGGKDSCQGDSGGPLVFQGKLIGIVSWGFGCGRLRYPGVYTNVNDKEIKSFIKQTAGI